MAVSFWPRSCPKRLGIVNSIFSNLHTVSSITSLNSSNSTRRFWFHRKSFSLKSPMISINSRKSWTRWTIEWNGSSISCAKERKKKKRWKRNEVSRSLFSFVVDPCSFLAAYSQIDWHDFVVVEVVDYQPQEQGNFPVRTPLASSGKS